MTSPELPPRPGLGSGPGPGPERGPEKRGLEPGWFIACDLTGIMRSVSAEKEAFQSLLVLMPKQVLLSRSLAQGQLLPARENIRHLGPAP